MTNGSLMKVESIAECMLYPVNKTDKTFGRV